MLSSLGKRPVLRVGVLPHEQAQLYSFVAKAREGFITDFLGALGEATERQVVVTQVSASEMEELVHNKTLDCVIVDAFSPLVIKKSITSIPCSSSAVKTLALLFWEKAPFQVTSLSDFSHYADNMTAVVRGTFEEHYLSLYTGIRQRRLDSIDHVVADVKLGVVRAGLIRYEDAYGIRRLQENLKVLPIAIDEKAMIPDEFLCAPNGNLEVIELLTRGVAKLKSTNQMNELYQTWFGAE